VLAGLFFQPAWAIWVLAILGVIVGLLNVTAEETRGFLLAAIALTLSATALNSLPIVGTAFSLVLPFVVAFVAGAMIVVALKELFQTARK
jgi:zinc transporter ZupT